MQITLAVAAAAAALLALSTEAFTTSKTFYHSKSISRLGMDNRDLGYSNNFGRDLRMDEPEPEVCKVFVSSQKLITLFNW
jgi:hypothetical protein